MLPLIVTKVCSPNAVLALWRKCMRDICAARGALLVSNAILNSDKTIKKTKIKKANQHGIIRQYERRTIIIQKILFFRIVFYFQSR